MKRMSSKKKKVEKSTKKTNEIDLSIDGEWTLQQIKIFVETLMDLTLCSDIHQLKNHKIPECVWKRLESRLKMDHIFLKNHWNYKLHLQLFCPEPIYMSDIKIKLIKFLSEKRITDKRSINWHDIAVYFDGITSDFLYQVFSNLIQTAKKKNISNNFEEQLQYLDDEYIPHLIKNAEDKVLPRLLYNEGLVSHI